MLNRREDELGRLILKLSHQIVKNRGRHALAAGLTASQADCMLFFSSRDEASVTQLKDYLGVTHQTAQGLVQRMTAKGLLTSRRSPQDSRVVLHLHPAMAPYKAAVLPLSKKLSGPAREIYQKLCKSFMVDFDETGSIGKRYRREDEIGTPLCITVDFETVGDGENPGDN